VAGRQALEEVVRMCGPADLELAHVAVETAPVEDDDSPRSAGGDEAREHVDEVVRVAALARVEQVVAVEEVQGRFGHDYPKAPAPRPL
jgi:hypothetical protein